MIKMADEDMELMRFLKTHTPEEIAKHQHYDKDRDMCFIVLPSGKRWRFYSCIYCEQKHHIRTHIEEWIIAMLIEDNLLDKRYRKNGRICGPCLKRYMDSAKIKATQAKADQDRKDKEKEAEREKKCTVIYGYD